MRFLIVNAGILLVLLMLPDADTGVRPLGDPVLWLRWLAGFCAVIWMPGRLLAGRFMKGSDFLGSFYASCAIGILLTTCGAFVFSLFHFPFNLYTYLPTVVVAAMVLGRRSSWRSALEGVNGEHGSRGWIQQLSVVAVCVIVLAVQIGGGRGFSAPVGPHDAVNHAFLVERISETASARSDVIFGEPWGAPLTTYIPGWHMAAALVAQAAGLAPWVSSWFLPLFALGLLPLAQAVLWRQFRLPPLAIGVGILFLVSNRQLMVESVKYACFGQFVGMLLAPLAVALMCRARRHRSVLFGVLAGLVIGMLMRVHASWALFSILFGLVALWRRRDEESGGGGRRALVAGLAVALLVCLVDVIPAIGDYRSRAMAPHPTMTLARGLQRLSFFLGRDPVAVCLLTVGAALGLLRRSTRPIALLSVMLAALTLGLAVYRDPVSLWLSQPVYQQFSRLFVPQIFLLPVLAGGVVFLLHRLLRRVMPCRLAGVLLVLPILYSVTTGCTQLNLAQLGRRTLFTEGDVRLAHRVKEHVPETDIVANWWLDGSPWAMYASGRRFMIPASWSLGWKQGLNRQQAIYDLVRDPWTPETCALETLSIHYIWATDHHLPNTPLPELRPEVFGADSRFTPVLSGKHSALFRIDWRAEIPDPQDSEPRQ